MKTHEQDYAIRTAATPTIYAVLHMCKYWANARSKDPNTKVGACIYDYTTHDMYFGYNGFASGVTDYEWRWQRPTKYEYVIHAEDNAICKALLAKAQLATCALVCTHKPCHKCMSKIIQAGIKTVYYEEAHDDSNITTALAMERGVCLTQIREEDVCHTKTP